MIKAILFDVDGTLIDSNDLHAAAWREAFLHFGIDLPHEAVRSQIGKGGDNLMPALLPPELVADKQEEIEAFRGDLFKRDYLPRVVPFARVRGLFERIASEHKKIVLASSANEDELRFHLGVIGAEDLVSATTSKDDVEHSKPDPDIFAAALAKAGVDAAEAVVIGDSPFDMQAAAKLGIRTIGFRSGGFPDEVLRQAGAAELYDSPADLLARYDQSLLSGQEAQAREPA
jgi:phosphoglycolate phosphatase-like HAD superfamily hydrolase